MLKRNVYKVLLYEIYVMKFLNSSKEQEDLIYNSTSSHILGAMDDKDSAP